jgi:hypothetical protein
MSAQSRQRAVWKWPIPMEVDFEIVMPKGAELLTVQTQYAGDPGESPGLWALVDPDAPRETRRFQMVGTGHREVGDLTYVGTFQVTGGSFVGHVFEVNG